MVVLKLAVLLQGLLLAARCEVRARDPEVEEEREAKDMTDFVGSDHNLQLVGFGAPYHDGQRNSQSPNVYEAVDISPAHGHHNPSEGSLSVDVPEEVVDPSTSSESRGSLMRTGNWCAFVDKRSVSVAVACGTEKYVTKSQSPCPSGNPDCQRIMYKLSTRPVYRQKQKIFTALVWRCCPGHTGENCEETGPSKLTWPVENPNNEQNDYQPFAGPQPETLLQDLENQTQVEASEQHNLRHHHRAQHFEKRGMSDLFAVNDDILPSEESYINHRLMPMLKEAVMSQLQPILETFNLTLERLSQEVQGLQLDMAHIRHNKEQRGVSEFLEEDGQQETVEEELRMSLQKLDEVKAQFQSHRDEIEERLHAQRSMWLYNMTNFKTDVDLKIKRNQKMLQVNLHTLNSSMVELKQEQQRLDENVQKMQTIPGQGRARDSSAVWEAITRLDNKVINNTFRLEGLTEGQDQMNESIKDLQSGWKQLKDKLTQTERNCQVKFMETGLEVDAAKAVVIGKIDDLSRNITALQGALQEMETDVDYIYTQYYKNISSVSGECDCIALGAGVTRLEQAVAHVVAIANENRLARESEDKQETGAWVPSVDDLKLGLLNVQKSLAFEQEKSRILHHNVSQLQALLVENHQDIKALQDDEEVKNEKFKHLASVFNTLLQDAIRHSDVLGILLGEEVLEFTSWSEQDKRLYSIPVVKESIRDMQEQINAQSLSLASMLNSGMRPEMVADEASLEADWASLDKKKSEERPGAHYDRAKHTDSDFLKLEKTVKELGVKLRGLEDRSCHSSCNYSKNGASVGGVRGRLHEELETLKRDFTEHLDIFNHIFSNTERLDDSGMSVDLVKLSTLLTRKKAKQQQNRRSKQEAERRAARPREPIYFRSKRDASLESAGGLRQFPESPFLFLASSTDGTNASGTVLFETEILNHGQIYSPKTGVFRAPAPGVYLFVVTLDFGPGPSLAQLKRGAEVAASLRQSPRKLGTPSTRVCILQMEQGEELRLELVQGTIEQNNPQDNTFAGLLMLQTT